MGNPLDVKRRPKRGAAKVRRLGKHKQQIQRYYERTYPRRKIRHLLRNNTVREARAWAEKHGALAFLHEVAAELKVKL